MEPHPGICLCLIDVIVSSFVILCGNSKFLDTTK